MQVAQPRPAISPVDRGSSALLKLTLVLVGLLAFCLWFGDRQGFEGDGLAIMFGIDNLELVGRRNVYRYYWQPLAYEVTAQLAGLLNSPLQINLIGSAFGAVGLGLLTLLLWRLLASVPYALLTSLVLLLCIPELTATALYFNASALALPFVSGSLLLLRLGRSKSGLPWPLLLAGALMALGCLFRLDFLVCVPFSVVLLIRWGASQWRRDALAYAAGVAIVLTAFVAAYPAYPREAIAMISGYGAGEYADSGARSVRVFLFTLGPAFIVLLLFARFLWKSRKLGGTGASRLFQGRDLWLLASLAPMLTPLTYLYSGKYLIPFFVCLLVVVAGAVPRAYRIAADKPLLWTRLGKVTLVLSALTVAIFTIAGVPDPASFRKQPLQAIFSEPLRAGMHDAFRTAGGYLRFAQWMRNFEHRHVKVKVAYDMAMLIDQCRNDVTVFMSSDPKYGENVWSWGWIPLYLGDHGWQLTEYEPAKRALLVRPGTRRTVVIARHDLAVPQTSTTTVLDFDQVSPQRGEDFWVAAKRWVDQMSDQNTCPA